MKKFIPYYYDAMFYKIFASDDDVSLLKRLIELSLNIEIESLTILNGKLLADKYKVMKSYLDLYVELKDKTKVNIEVNSNTASYIYDRNLFFLSKIMSNGIEVGDTYYDFKKHYQINLNASNKRQKLPVMKYNILNKETNEIFSDKLEIINIDLVYFYNICYTNSEYKNLTEFEKLMGLLGCKSEEDQKIFNNEKGMIKTIMEKADKFRDDSGMIEMYDRDTMFEHLRRKELKETTKEVTKEVKHDTINKIAINMLNKGMNIKDISDITGLDTKEIEKLKKDS